MREICKKYGITEEDLKKVDSDVINKGIKAITNVNVMLAILELLTYGDIKSKSFDDKDSLKLVLKISKDGQTAVIAFKDGNNFHYVIGNIPQEFKNIHVGSIIDYWYSGAYFFTLDEAYKAFEKIGK